MSGHTIHDGAIGYEVAYRHERLMAEAEAHRMRSQLPRTVRGDHRTAFRSAAVAMAAATGLLVVSGAWASLLGAPSSSVTNPAPAAAPGATTLIHGGGGGAGGAVAQ